MNRICRLIVTFVASMVCLFGSRSHWVVAADAARPILVIPYPDLKAQLNGADPLPMERTWQRLKQEGIDEIAAYVQEFQSTKSYPSRIAHYRQQTLVIEWDEIPGARWALNVEGHLSSLPTGKVRLPQDGWKRFRWERDGDQKCTLIYENDDPKASLHVAFHAKQDHVDYSLTVKADDQTRDHVVTHLCFNHCWADGFGRDALVLAKNDQLQRLGDIPNPERIWIRVATLSDPTYAKLKREQFAIQGIGSNLNEKRLTGLSAAKIKVPVGDLRGRFIATQRAGGRASTVAINSPNAISVGWSFWPCTDIDLAFGTVRPRESKTVAGRIWFLKGGIEKALDKVRLSDK